GQDMQLTPRCKRVIDLAYDEARTLNNNYIGTEHLLLGLIREGEGLAGRILTKLGVQLERTRAEVQSLQESQPKSDAPPVQPTPPPDAERAALEALLRAERQGVPPPYVQSGSATPPKFWELVRRRFRETRVAEISPE